MNKKLKWLLLTPLVFSASSGLTSCSKSDNYLLLRVINSEDYIYLQEDDEEPEDLVIQFEKSDAVKAFLEAKEAEGKHYEGVRVIYDTSDTNETLYSELQTGKSNYDLMNVSDYMAQKIVASKMAVPLYQKPLSAVILGVNTKSPPCLRPKSHHLELLKCEFRLPELYCVNTPTFCTFELAMLLRQKSMAL